MHQAASQEPTGCSIAGCNVFELKIDIKTGVDVFLRRATSPPATTPASRVYPKGTAISKR